MRCLFCMGAYKHDVVVVIEVVLIIQIVGFGHSPHFITISLSSTPPFSFLPPPFPTCPSLLPPNQNGYHRIFGGMAKLLSHQDVVLHTGALGRYTLPSPSSVLPTLFPATLSLAHPSSIPSSPSLPLLFHPHTHLSHSYPHCLLSSPLLPSYFTPSPPLFPCPHPSLPHSPPPTTVYHFLLLFVASII